VTPRPAPWSWKNSRLALRGGDPDTFSHAGIPAAPRRQRTLPAFGEIDYADRMKVITDAAATEVPPVEAATWVEQLRVPDLSVGTYRVPAGGVDGQRPHTEDEIYVVVAGQARLVTPTDTTAVGPGSVVFVPAGEEHRFVDITEDLVVLVVFAPAEGSRASGTAT